MAESHALSTGLPALDTMLQGIRAGDNIVWQVDSIEHYAGFVRPFYTEALRAGRKLIYFRFARHAQLVPDDSGAEIHRLSPELGFESFTAAIHQVIEARGPGAFYVFDCLSDLAADWYSDLMLGNFFLVTCPYLYDLETVTYFALLRAHHSVDAVAAIRETTQVLIDVFRDGDKVLLHPLKVEQRQSPTMYLPHVWEGAAFRAVTESAVLSDMLVRLTVHRTGGSSPTTDVWERAFLDAEAVLSGARPAQDAEEVCARLCRMMLTRDELVMALVGRYLDLTDLLNIRKRMIGTGLIGGKALGMLLARAILCRASPRWREKLESHDSFFIGSDVFYSFLVRNDCWRVRRTQRRQMSFLEGAAEARQRILTGTFPPFMHEHCVAMLGHFGQSPIVVRSSSLLEDSFGNAFTGKYESVFCPNQGSPEERLAAFLAAVRTVYASTMSAEALLYRARRGLLDSDEQMAVLVQRVSGAVYGKLYYPQVAGVALSYNPYVWSEYIDPHAGVLRLVFGLGTRAVERCDDDYTRIVALNAPQRRPDRAGDETVEYAQRRVDVIDLSADRLQSLPSDDVLHASPGLPVDLFASQPRRLCGEDRQARAAAVTPWVLTFDRLLRETAFADDMREMLALLAQAYSYPVDTEFTANFLADGTWRINLVQCRPFQVKECGKVAPLPERLEADDIIFEAHGTIIGQSSLAAVERLVYVIPSAYGALPVNDRYALARMIGRLLHGPEAAEEPKRIVLLGPGRWGTGTPSLGVPVSFAEINTVSVLCEIAALGGDVVPDISLGTHFFNDLVESNILYLAIDPAHKGNNVNEEFFLSQPNALAAVAPEEALWAPVVRVIEVPLQSGAGVYVNANCLTQSAVCYRATVPQPGA